MAKKEFVLSVILQAVDKVTAPLRALQETIQAVNQIADETAAPFKTLSEAFKEVNKAVSETTSSLQAGKEALSGVGNVVKKAASSLGNVEKSAKNASTQIKTVGGAISSIKRASWRDKFNISELSESVKKVSASLSRVKGALGGVVSLAGVAAGAVTAYGGAIAAVVKRTTDYADVAVKTAQRIGIGVEAWQELAYAGNLSGAESEMFANMLAKLNKRIIEAANGSEDAALWLNRAGVAFKDSGGRARSAEAVFLDIADAFAKHEDGAKKTAIAMGLFEEEGTKLIPLLNSGKAGIQAMREEARRLGIVMSEEDAKASEAFNDNVSRLQETFWGFCNFLVSELLPVFDEIVVSVREWMLANSDLIRSSILEWVKSFKAALPGLIENFWAFVNGVRDFVAFVSQNIEKIGGFTTALKILATVIGVTLVGALASAVTAIVSLGTALLATPAGWIIMGIAAAALAVYAAFKNWDKIRGILSALADLWTWPLRKLNEFIEYLTGINLFEIGKNIIGSLWDGFKAKWEDVKSWFGGLKNLIPVFNMQNVPVAQDGSQGPPRPFLPYPSDTPGAMATRKAAAAYAGAGAGRSSQTETKSSAAVEVKFSNLPKGTTVNTVENKGVDLKLNQGYAFVTP